MSAPPWRVALVTHRWAAAAPTGMGRHAHGLATGLAQALGGDDGRGGAGARPAGAGTDARGRPWAVTATGAAEGDAGPLLPAALGWAPLPGPRKARLAAWRLLGRPRVDGPLGRPDLVHSLLPFVPVPTAARFVQTVPDTIPLRHPDWHRRFERWGFAGGFARLGAADAVVVSSRHVAGEVVALGIDPARVAVVPLGVDEAFFVPAGAERVAAVAARHGVEPGRYLVAVGQRSARKNLAVLLGALAALPPAGGVELLVVGPDGDLDVVAAAERLGVGGRVRVAGFVADDELRVLLQGALALVHPSTEEGFGLTPLEAMASGTPAVVAASSSLPEVVGDAGVVVDPGDPSAWAAAIARIRDDPAAVASLVAAGRAHAAARRWVDTAAGHLDVWAAVLDGAPLPGAQPSADR